MLKILLTDLMDCHKNLLENLQHSRKAALTTSWTQIPQGDYGRSLSVLYISGAGAIIIRFVFLCIVGRTYEI